MRFDIRAHDCTYFFRVSGMEEKTAWVETIEANKVSIYKYDGIFNQFPFLVICIQSCLVVVSVKLSCIDCEKL